MDINQWKVRNKGVKKYSHFDKRVSINKVWNYISSSKNVARHGFYPFIHYTQKFYKFTKEKGRYLKERQICYSAHMDRCIYQYYGFLLNQKYNERVISDGLNEVCIAYRDNLGKSNINFSKQAFDFIKQHESCYIMVGDFTNFFDKLNHVYLKERICDLLENKILPEDYYAVFKNITKYSTWELTDLLTINGLSDTMADRKKLNSNDQVLTIDKFKAMKKQFVIKHKEQYGIPQGSAISAVLSNIYMLKVDKLINEYILTKSGMYMRYSDDFIIIIPTADAKAFQEVYDIIVAQIGDVPDLKLEPKKTQLYYFDHKKITNCNNIINEDHANGKDILDYLGFSFNGNSVVIRGKTISKYYYRMYRKANNIVKNKGVTSSGKKISCKNLYEKYSIKGAYLKKGVNKKNGNFFTYVNKAKELYKDEPINYSTKNHMRKIRTVLKKI